jgi:glutamate N-acetyltransferase / amino-acid N-acetyltransferase
MTVTSPRGFRAAGVAAGLKSSGAQDVALVVNEGPDSVAAAVFTANRFPAAPVVWSRQVVQAGDIRAVVLNSGGANACTGPDGFLDTHRTAEFVAQVLSTFGHETGAGEIAVCSTGLIGERLSMEALLGGIERAAGQLSTSGGPDAARAIMTTDSVPKQAVFQGEGYQIGGMAKGAGMLAPALATMLVVVTTDAVIDSKFAHEALVHAVSKTFDRLDSDGCMSTNDTVLLMSSGATGIAPEPEEFTRSLTAVCADLARQLIADAEGATKDICITVSEAKTESDALEVARAIARSNLLKCAIHGEDPNWGRVLSAIGTTSASFESAEVDVAINDVWVCRGGAVGDSRELVDMTPREVKIDVRLQAGELAASIWTNDLTAQYVHENSAYST